MGPSAAPPYLRRLGSALCLIAAGSWSCSTTEKVDTGADDTAHVASDTLSAPAASPLGVWTVVGHRMAAVSALAEDQAAAWHGREIHLTEMWASFEGDTCRSPHYVERDADVAEIGRSYRILPAALGLSTGAGATARTVRVSCGSDEWASAGGYFILRSPDEGFIVRDGVFFEVQRAH